MNQRRRRIKILFTIYTLLMVYLLFLQRIGDSGGMAFSAWVCASVNLIPGRTIFNLIRGAWNGWYYRGSTTLLRFALINNLGNIVLFLPLGCFLPALWKTQRRWVWFVLTATGTILLVETLQLLTMLGSWDMDDLILNVLGATLGFHIWRRGQRRKNPEI